MLAIGRYGSRYILPIASQGVISLSNLAVGVLLARETSPDEYGLYVLGFSIALTLVGVQESLVSIPLTVRTANLAVAARVRLFRASSRVLGAAILGVGSVAVLAMACATWLGFGGSIEYTAAMAFAAFGWAAWDFKRVKCFAVGSTRTLMIIDFAYLSLLSTVVVTLFLTDRLSATAMLATVGLAGTVGALTASRPHELVELQRRRFGRVARYWWALGRWSLATAQTTWLQSQGYIYIVSVVLGLQALAAISAARMLFAPLATIQTAWSRVALPRLTAVCTTGGWKAVRPIMVKSLAAIGGIHVVWAIVVFLSIDFLSRVLFLGKFDGIFQLSLCWACAMLANAFRTVIHVTMRAFSEYRRMSRLALLGAVVVASGTPPAAWWFGPAGAIAVFGAAELLLGALAWQSLRREDAVNQPS